jgi:hypothetical protein
VERAGRTAGLKKPSPLHRLNRHQIGRPPHEPGIILANAAGPEYKGRVPRRPREQLPGGTAGRTPNERFRPA